MKRNHHLKGLIDNIKKTEEIIAINKANGALSIVIAQYEAIKAKQISELIHLLAIPPYQTVESISVIKHILDKFYPDVPADIVKLKELEELEDAI
jgi:hypothetical protein